MTATTLNVRSTEDVVRTVIDSLPKELSGGSSAVVKEVLTRIGVAMLGKIERAFIAKSRGGTDETGDRWAPLKPATIAYGRAQRGKRQIARDARPSQGLTKRQQARWWDLYRQGLAIYRGNKASAARRAWGIVKREGGRSIMDRYGGARALILQDSGQLLRSLTPDSGSADQVLRVARGSVVVGTSRPGAMAHHRGSPSGGLPQRKLWPDVQDWPASWWDDILREVQRGLVGALTDKLRGK